MTLDSLFARLYFDYIPKFSIEEYYERNIKRC